MQVWHVPCGGITYGDDNLVFIANDWHTALLPVYLQVGNRGGGRRGGRLPACQLCDSWTTGQHTLQAIGQGLGSAQGMQTAGRIHPHACTSSLLSFGKGTCITTTPLLMVVQAHYRDYGQMTYARAMFVIHNMAHQGRGPMAEVQHLELNEHYKEMFRCVGG